MDKTWLRPICILGLALSSLAALAQVDSGQQERSFTFLHEHFSKYPKQILKGKVITRQHNIESGEATLYLQFPQSLSFQYTGSNSFDSTFHKNTYKVVSYPRGRKEVGQTEHFSKIENLIIATLARAMTSLKDESIAAFLLGPFFDWKMQIRQQVQILSVQSSNKLSSLQKMELRFSDKQELTFIQTEVSSPKSVYEFYVLKAEYPKNIPSSVFE